MRFWLVLPAINGPQFKLVRKKRRWALKLSGAENILRQRGCPCILEERLKKTDPITQNNTAILHGKRRRYCYDTCAHAPRRKA